MADGGLSPEKGEGDPGLPKPTRNRVCERGRRGGRRRGGEGEKPEGTEQRGGAIRPAVFSVQPRNDKTQVFSFKTKKKKKKSTSPRPPPPLNHIDHAQYFPNKIQAHIHHPQICTHVINSLEPRERQSVSSVARRPRVLPPSGESISSRRIRCLGIPNLLVARLKFQSGWGSRSSPTRARRAGPWEAPRPVPGGRGGGGPGPRSRACGRARPPVGTDVRAGLVVAAGAEGRAHTEVVGGKVQQGGRVRGPRAGRGLDRHHRPPLEYLALVMR